MAAKKLNAGELAAQYGYAASFFNSDPELKKLLDSAVKEQWTAEKFQAKLMTTNWYRTKSSDTRTWIELEKRDPAEAKARLDRKVFEIRQLAQTMGFVMPQGELDNLARTSLMYGYEDAYIREIVGGKIPGGNFGGETATMESWIRKAASDYGVTLSDSTIANWVRGSMQGKYSEDHLTDFIKDQAISKYPGIAASLQKGMTVRDIAEPYIQSYAAILEVPADEVQVQDNRIQQALQGKAAKPGETPTSQTVYDFEKTLRQDPRWLKTKNANSEMLNSASGILRDWGLTA